jgi:hypothetical protein
MSLVLHSSRACRAAERMGCCRRSFFDPNPETAPAQRPKLADSRRLDSPGVCARRVHAVEVQVVPCCAGARTRDHEERPDLAQ